MPVASCTANRIAVTATNPLNPVVNLVLSIARPPEFDRRSLRKMVPACHGKVLEMLAGRGNPAMMVDEMYGFVRRCAQFQG